MGYAAFLLATGSSMMPMMSASFMISSSWDFDLGPRPFPEQHPVTGLYIDRNKLAGLVAAARPNGYDFALRRLFLGGVGDDDAPADYSSAAMRLTTTRS